MFAMKNNNINAVKILLEAGADPDLKDNLGDEARHY